MRVRGSVRVRVRGEGEGCCEGDICLACHPQDKIFNSIYHDSPPEERVKYGVLNIGECGRG